MVFGLLLLDIQSVIADALDNWTTTVVTNQYGFSAFPPTELEHIVYGNGFFVAYAEEGDAGVFYSSPDGTNWTQRYTDLNSWGMNLVYSSGRYVGVGPVEYAISTDGTSWTASFTPSGYWYGIAFSGSRYVMVGGGSGVGAIVSSTDGVSWTSRTATAMGGTINSVVWGGSRFVAIGNNDGYEYTASALATSWTRSSIPGGSKISYVNGLYFVPLNNQTNLISTDGINWSPNLTGLTNQLGTITYANGIYLSLLYSTNQIPTGQIFLATSVDTTNWTQYSQPLPNSYYSTRYDNMLATDGSRLVVLDNFTTGAPHYYSTNYARVCYPLVGVRLTNNPARSLAISGLVGRNYQIQSSDSLGAAANWRTNAILQLANTPYVWSDSTATNSARFYRGVLMP